MRAILPSPAGSGDAPASRPASGRSPFARAATITLTYAILATVWIYASDHALEALLPDPAQRVDWSVYKGVGFVVLTSLLLFLMMRRDFGAIESSFAELALTSSRLQATQGQLVAVVRSAMDAILSVDQEGRVVLFNDAAEALFGWPEAEALGQSLGKFIPGGLEAAESAQILIQGRHRDGREIPLEASLSLVQAGERQLRTVILRDISQRLAHEREIERLRRLYSALSEVNQAIVWCTDRESLLQRVCRALVEAGGFTMTWVGWNDPVTHRLDVVATAGDRDGFLGRLEIYSDERPEGTGAAGRAFREAKVQVNRDFSNSARDRPWFDEALRLGLRSSAAFPIRMGGEVVGVLSVYTDEVECFQDREVELLTEATGDLSFALDNLRREAERQRAETALRSERSFSDTMIESMPGILYFYDAEGRFLRWNKSLESFSGYSAEEIATMQPWDFFAAEDRPALKERIAEAFEKGGSLLEAGFLSRTGDVTPCFFTGRRVEYHGRPCLVGVGVDISARVEAERALARSNQALQQDIAQRRAVEESLRESEERFRQLAENINEVFWVFDLASRDILYVSPAYERVWGRSCQSLYAAPGTWLEAVHSEDRARVELALAGQANGTYDVTYRIVRPDETTRWIRDRAFPVTNAQGEKYRVVGTAEDVTERREADERIREQAALLDQTQDAILVRDLSHRVLFWNKSAERIFGWSGAEARGTSVLELIYGDRGPFELAMKVVLAHGTWAGELKQRTRAGAALDVEARWALLRDARGVPVSVLAIDTDVTAQKRIEAQFLRAQRLESIGTLAGGIAHDLNNLLSPIVMGVELLRQQEQSESARRVIDLIEQSARRGTQLVKQVLSFSRGVESARVAVHLGHLLREVEAIIASTFPKNIRFAREVAADLWLLVGDPTQLHQVLMNLCVNARDAMPRGGRLTVRARNAAIDELFAAQHHGIAPGRYVRLEVADEGCGISPEVMDRIFEPFFTTKEKGKGTGLGLSTALGIVRNHGGFLNLRSEPGQGTCFEILLPAQPEGVDAGAPLRPAQSPRGKGEWVLVVDDESAIAAVMRETLEAHGYHVVIAGNGAEALGAFAVHRAQIAVVVTDMMMPVLDGAGLVAALHRIDPGVRVIATSGAITPDPTIGIRHFLPKPCSAEQLLAVLRSTLDEPAHGGEAKAAAAD